MKKKEKQFHSSIAEYLIYIASTGDTQNDFEIRYEDENIWLTKEKLSVLFGVNLSTINELINDIINDSEVEETSDIRKYRITEITNKKETTKEDVFYNLSMIISLGFRIDSERAVLFRKWMGQIVKDFSIQGWSMDVNRFKNGHMFNDDYFLRLLDEIDEIRRSNRNIYQRVTDLYATAFDYDKDAKTTKEFYQAVKEKLEINKTTINIMDKEITTDNLISSYLDYAEQQAKNHIPLTMENWANRLDSFL